MSLRSHKRTVDLQVITDWVTTSSRVLDLGCGRGVLLQELAQQKRTRGIGVDLEVDKISACVKRGLSAYQGDMMAFMESFDDGHFDHVICSRTLEEVDEPARVIAEALRVGRSFTIGFANHGFWKNRLDALFLGRKPRNDVYQTSWGESRPANPLTIADFEDFCRNHGYRITKRVHLRGDWKTPNRLFPNLCAGYALYELTH
ncbi:methionine biosynthesis protein MetW [Synoicihabitans lomoniglobus]|uniref:Methionine biosynthesis protein MetW n=1 Tax=Synoicihabitans lomoniglobus TaxID=2909285 RepID=A0AAE9ZUY3_9BACT|nr:methionine biosynthesis protein MetW [Opitutaceae bacterium LMO-M01]WED63821.1 methionine biosynthesis protein MetW [Opitutaceae bacterium LMO-M01]